jgi:hypothetical protein
LVIGWPTPSTKADQGENLGAAGAPQVWCFIALGLSLSADELIRQGFDGRHRLDGSCRPFAVSLSLARAYPALNPPALVQQKR